MKAGSYRFFKASLYSEADLSWDTKQADLQRKCFLESSEFQGSLFLWQLSISKLGYPCQSKTFLEANPSLFKQVGCKFFSRQETS